MVRKIVYILFFVGFVGFSQQNPVSIQIDTTNIRIGEQINLKILVDDTRSVEFPKLRLDSLGMLEVIESKNPVALKNKIEKTYVLSSFDSGKYTIPRQSVLVNKKEYLTNDLIINVATVKVDTTKKEGFPIKSIIREPKVFDDYKPLMWWLVPIVLIIAIGLFFIFRKKKEKIVKVVYIPPIQEALQRLKELDQKELIKQNKIKIYYSELTDIVRTYIEKEMNVPALESTTNELIETIYDFNASSNLGISKETIKELKDILESADLVKFAKLKPIFEEIKGHRNISERIVQTIKPIVQSEEDIEGAENGENAVAETSNYHNKYQSSKSKKKKKSWLRYIIIFISVGVIGLSALGYFGYKYVKDNYLGSTTSEMMTKPWYTSSYGNPSISLESPEILKVENAQLPENVMELIDDFQIYYYGSLISNFYIGATSISFKGEMPGFNLENSMQGSLNEIENTSNTTFTNIEKEEIVINGIEGLKATAKYSAENQITKKKMNYNFTILLFGNTKNMRQIIVSHLEEDEDAKKIKERVLNSISISN